MPKGTADRERPLRIALAALEVVADKGVEGLTHRAVAAVADIPLGSTTYHFRTLDDLLAAAIVEAKKATDDDLAVWADGLGPGSDLADAVTDYVMNALTQHWDRLVVEHELYMAALRRPQLRSLSREWDKAFPAVLSLHTDTVTAETVAMVVDGMFVRALIHGMPSRDEVQQVLRRLLP
ncbi:DNA-binding transcriptional regulator [Nocardia sp. NPDC052254]|uniref:TetR/AcrR family transcriptional regulator n=1 Tax=Nocardia sp. NPDC052254 TaxID=3155681 RepID=UPI003446F889